MPNRWNVKDLAARTYIRGIGALCGLILACAVIAGASAGGNDGTIEASNNDPWRRTENGWELVDRWNQSAGIAESSPISLRFDSHPAALALLQALAVVGAFALFPQRGGARS